ncbi:signal peptidase I [Asticcacaulis sp. BYS171W]|uniref:Signal peptidase I n=1 Tax=Asticcacaulis aquaticus TaxID=2984212 RepID=A0ABT5HPC2_9CAUL|nr:signal peptidase I [Asticcacaulis aquaticus]MDC7681918.1 signal peptidase I [Asticcacaulis aquaticus]
MSAEDKVIEDGIVEGEKPAATLKDETMDIIKTVAIALLITLVFRTFLFQPFTIPSASMEPNLYEGDYIVVRKWDYGYSKHSIQFSPPVISGRIFEKQAKRGDIVVFKLPRDNKTDYIKRVVGLPGDRVQVRDGKVYINEAIVPVVDKGPISTGISYATPGVEVIEESLPNGATHLTQDMGYSPKADDTEVFTVPEGQYFVMGDNRDNSLDSRFSPSDYMQPGVGFVPAENLEGKATMVLISWNKGASLFKPWTWLDLRWDRFFKSLD